MDLAEEVHQDTRGPFGLRQSFTGEEALRRAHHSQVDVYGHVAGGLDLPLDIAEGVRLARPSPTEEHLVVGNLDCGRNPRVHERLPEVLV